MAGSYTHNRAAITGQQDDGTNRNAAITSEGHLEVSIHEPKLPFGAINTESLTPVFQADAVYGLNSYLVSSGVTGSGWAYTNDSNFIVQTGTQIYSSAQIQSRKRLRYRPGQGVIARFAGLYTSGVTNSYQVAGVGHAEDGLFFGYKDTAFGILYSRRGVREVRTLTITVASSTNENATITLNGVAFSVAVTNSGNIQRTVWEISQGTFLGWKAYPSGATVVFVKDAVGVVTGSFSLTASTAQGTFAQTSAGAAATETFYPQNEWNGDKLDGTGGSGITANWQKGNVFEIGIEYLGFGAFTFKVEIAPDNTNNPRFIVVHTIKNPNTLTTTSFGNPAFPFTMAAYSAGSTTNLTTKVGSVAGFIDGAKKLHGPRTSYYNQLTTVGATNYQALFTILNKRYFGGRSNQSVINLLSVSGALKHTSPCIFYLIRNGALAGNPNFTDHSTQSCSSWDTAATTVTFTSNSQILWSGHLGDTGDLDHHFNGGNEDLTLQPGEWLTLAAKSVTGTPSYVTGSINTREDQ